MNSGLQYQDGPRASRRRASRLLALVAMVAVPLGVLAAAEMGLRAAGYGRSMRPFVKRSSGDQCIYIRNLGFFDQFFSGPTVSDMACPDNFEIVQPKAANAYRIFVFGGSAAQGWPGPEAAFPRILKAMLKVRFPETDFQIYNMAYVSMNSHVMRPLAMACARLAPDAFLVYMGNNEISGPFGMFSDVPNSGTVPDRGMIRAHILLSDSRLRQWLSCHVPGALGWLSRASSPPAPQSLPRPDDPRLPTIYEYFKANLADLSHAGRTAGAQVVLGTVGVNLRDWTPTNSLHLRALSEAERVEWDRLFSEGAALQNTGNYREALDAFARAAAIGDTHAELLFRIGRCHFELGEYEQARERFVKALDYDTFAWARAKSPINEVIRFTASEYGYPLADAEARLAACSQGGVPGEDMFCDACHLTFRGNYVIAAAFFDRLIPVLPRAVLGQLGAIPTPPSEEECRRLLCLNPMQEAEQRAAAADTDWRLDDEARRRALAEAQKRKAALLLDTPEQRIACLEAALGVMAPDYPLQERLVREWKDRGDMGRALHEAQVWVNQFPYNRQSRWASAEILCDTERYEEAMEQLEHALVFYPEDAETLILCGDVLQRAGRPDDALLYYARAQTRDPIDLNSEYLRAQSLEDVGDTRQAAAAYREIIVRNPDFAECFERLDGIYRTGDGDRVAQWRSYVSSTPESYWGRMYLGQALEEAGAPEEALACFREASRISPKEKKPRERAAVVLENLGRPEEAIEIYRDLALNDPLSSDAKREEGRLLERLGRDQEAIEAYVAAALIRTQPEDFYAGVNALTARVLSPDDRVNLWRRLAMEGPQFHLVYEYLGRALEAAQDFTAAEAAHAEAARLAARVERRSHPDTGSSDEATETMSEPSRYQTMQASATEVRVLRTHASVAASEGKPEDALRLYIDALRMDIHDLETYEAIDALFASGALADGKKQLWRRVIEACPDSGRAYWYFARALKESGDADGALAALGCAAERSPRDAGVQAELGRALLDAGRFDASIPPLRRAIEINPEIVYARLMLVAAFYQNGDRNEARAELAQCRERNIEVPEDLVRAVEGGSVP
ncbi:MAG TPA: tetratricopeptide repeat protein [Candidatus Hydrogenedentes bacterium]|nr:tetratricopeptide repeat protein [Candidatus Hydrogenedentota bacterium]HPG65946.1 tetratricopeptide repeat protein [Candidatus Hydrogenedentota bacterium]